MIINSTHIKFKGRRAILTMTLGVLRVKSLIGNKDIIRNEPTEDKCTTVRGD